MSKIKTLEHLVDRISDQSKIRKRELIKIKQMLPPATREPGDFWLRIAPVMAYAHWEGFVKESATAYLLFLSRKTVALSRLKPNLQALACRAELLGAVGATKRIAPHLAIVSRLVDNLTTSVTVPVDVIDTESNLNWAVFENICNIVGIATSGFWSERRGFIDDLFITRCDVAHGQLFTPDAADAVHYLNFALDAIPKFGTDLENAASTNSHLRPTIG
jgi:hypothetical protein